MPATLYATPIVAGLLWGWMIPQVPAENIEPVPSNIGTSVRDVVVHDAREILQKEHGVSIPTVAPGYRIKATFLGQDGKELGPNQQHFRSLRIYEPIEEPGQAMRWTLRATLSSKNYKEITLPSPSGKRWLFASYHSVEWLQTTLAPEAANDAIVKDSWKCVPMTADGAEGYRLEFTFAAPNSTPSSPAQMRSYPGTTVVTMAGLAVAPAATPAASPSANVGPGFIRKSSKAKKASASPSANVQPGFIRINEVMAKNKTTKADEAGEFDDWVELINTGPEPFDVGGLYLSDKPGNLQRWRIPQDQRAVTTIAPGGVLLIWCDEQPAQGPLHAPFKLNSKMERLVLVAADGRTVIDSVSYPALPEDHSYARDTGKIGTWAIRAQPTPGRP